MKDLIKKWSFLKVKSLLETVDNLMESESQQLREAAKDFQALGDLSTIESLADGDPNNPKMPQMLFQRLSAYFDVGLLLQRAPGAESANWWVTDCMWKGIVFHLDLKEQISAVKIVPEISPLQVQTADAQKVMEALGLGFFLNGMEAEAYIIKPTPHLSYLLISQLPKPWSHDHLQAAQKLINKCFIY